MGNYTPNPFMTQPAHLPPLITTHLIYSYTVASQFVRMYCTVSTKRLVAPNNTCKTAATRTYGTDITKMSSACSTLPLLEPRE